MADQKKWFKVWGSILNDPIWMGLPLDHRARWIILGAWMSQHGDSGTLTTPESSLRKVLEIPDTMITEDVIKVLPNVSMRRGVNDNDEITVIIKKWAEYQKDSTSYDRVKKWRKKQNDNGVRGEERRGEEKRKERTPISPLGDVANVMEFLNQKTGKRFEMSTNGSGKLTEGATLIQARLADGRSMQDCRKVIANRIREWKDDPKMRKFLTPNTLFRKSNFDKYYGGLNWEAEEEKHEVS